MKISEVVTDRQIPLDRCAPNHDHDMNGMTCSEAAGFTASHICLLTFIHC